MRICWWLMHLCPWVSFSCKFSFICFVFFIKLHLSSHEGLKLLIPSLCLDLCIAWCAISRTWGWLLHLLFLLHLLLHMVVFNLCGSSYRMNIMILFMLVVNLIETIINVAEHSWLVFWILIILQRLILVIKWILLLMNCSSNNSWFDVFSWMHLGAILVYSFTVDVVRTQWISILQWKWVLRLVLLVTHVDVR